ncbi:MAG: TraB/GumN family protein [Pseudomonadota bacterium]
MRASQAFRRSILVLGAILFASLVPGMAGAQALRDCPPDAAPPTRELFAAAAANARDRGLLWRVSRGGHSSHLYGTLHVGRAGWMAPGPLVRAALRASDTIGLELDPLDETLHRDMAAAMAARPPARLPAALQERLRKAWAAACLPEEARAGMAAEMQAITVVMLSVRRDGLQVMHGSEVLLSLLGRGGGRNVISLESPALQLQAMLAGDDAEAAEMVQGMLDQLDDGRVARVIRKTIAVWESADLAELERFREWCECTSTDSDRKFMARLLEGRNPGLADRIEALHTQGRRVFAGVGAAHMAGPEGLPALLRARGFTVERLR